MHNNIFCLHKFFYFWFTMNTEKQLILEKWDGKAKSRSEVASLIGINRRMLNDCIKGLEDENKLDLGSRRVLFTKEVKIILEVYY